MKLSQKLVKILGGGGGVKITSNLLKHLRNNFKYYEIWWNCNKYSIKEVEIS